MSVFMWVSCELDACVLLCVGYLFLLVVYMFFFFKQKTAYEMRISDWSSDVCSSDLGRGHEHCCCGRNCGQQPLRCSPTRRVSSIQDSGLRRGYRGEAVPRWAIQPDLPDPDRGRPLCHAEETCR